MPYNPKAATQGDRTFACNALWLGLPLPITLLASLRFGPLNFIVSLCAGIVAGVLIAVVYCPSRDGAFAGESA